MTVSLDLDDAFSEGDDVLNYAQHFSPDAIRDELARNMPADDGVSAADASVSTLDMNGRHESEASTSRSASPAASFSQISLDDKLDDMEDIPGDTEDDRENTDHPPNETIDSSEHPFDDSDDQDNVIPYPNVVIDVSASPGHRIAVSSEKANGEDPVDGADPLAIPKLSVSSPPPREQPSSSPADKTSFDNDARSTPDPPLSPTDASPSTSSQKRFSHRPSKSAGPSTFEKVRSRTRPVFLPPKGRKEDDKHLADWETMMKLSKTAAEKRRMALQDRRLEREMRIEESLQQWEREIVPDWKIVHKDPRLRRLWWEGVPTKLRAQMWEQAVGNGLALSKETYKTCLSRAKRAFAAGTFPQASLDLLEEDISTTLPSLHLFSKDAGPMYSELRDILFAWVVARSDDGFGYTFGAAKIAGMLLINMPAQQAFIVMRNLLERHCLRCFFGGKATQDDVEAYYRIFDTLLADGMPKIYFNFKQHQISPSAYLPDWLIPVFLDHLPFEACARLWDVILLEGDSFLYRAALGILAVLEPRLFFPDRKELLDLLRGENKAALDVATREGRPLDGGKYEIYGVDEETLWDRIDAMDEWWKESTWKRLITRELPDL